MATGAGRWTAKQRECVTDRWLGSSVARLHRVVRLDLRHRRPIGRRRPGGRPVTNGRLDEPPWGPECAGSDHLCCRGTGLAMVLIPVVDERPDGSVQIYPLFVE
jgi:hypothetical protein